MEWVETTGRTVEEAKDAALDQLGVDETDAEFEILEEPRGGLFGRLRSEARVRARVRPTKPPPKVDRRDRRRRRRGGPGDAEGDVDVEAGRERSDQPRQAAQKGPRERRPRSHERTAAGRAEEQRRPEDGEGGTMVEGPSLDEQAAVVEEFIEGMLDAFGVDATTSRRVSEDEDGAVEVNVEGDQLGLLIGPRGQTLDAVQELARTVLQRHTVGAPNARVRIDVSGYRQRRREALVRFATDLAEEVKSSGAAKALEPMSPADRKVVHDTVNEIPGVVTSSEGAEPRRRVVISPEGPAES